MAYPTSVEASPEMTENESINASYGVRVRQGILQLQNFDLTLEMGLRILDTATKHYQYLSREFEEPIKIYVAYGARSHPEDIRMALNIVNPKDWCKCAHCDIMLYLEECVCCRQDKGPCEALCEVVQKIINDKCNERNLQRNTHEDMRAARKDTYTQIAIAKFLPSLPPDDPRHSMKPEEVMIPSCMKWAVRSRLRDPNDQYIGYPTRHSESENHSSASLLNHSSTGSFMISEHLHHDDHVQVDSDISKSSSKVSMCSTPDEDEEEHFRNIIQGSFARATAVFNKQKLLDSERQKQVEDLSLKQLRQMIDILVLVNQNRELESTLTLLIRQVIKTVTEKHLEEMKPLLSDIVQQPWCTCEKCHSLQCPSDEWICCGMDKGNCLTDSKEFKAMLNTVQQEFMSKLKEEKNNGKQNEEARKDIYDRAKCIIAPDAGNETIVAVPNCVKYIARVIFPDPDNIYNGRPLQ